MKHRDYLFMTVLLLILTFSLSEAAIRDLAPENQSTTFWGV